MSRETIKCTAAYLAQVEEDEKRMAAKSEPERVRDYLDKLTEWAELLHTDIRKDPTHMELLKKKENLDLFIRLQRLLQKCTQYLAILKNDFKDKVDAATVKELNQKIYILTIFAGIIEKVHAGPPQKKARTATVQEVAQAQAPDPEPVPATASSEAKTESAFPVPLSDPIVVAAPATPIAVALVAPMPDTDTKRSSPPDSANLLAIPAQGGGRKRRSEALEEVAPAATATTEKVRTDDKLLSDDRRKMDDDDDIVAAADAPLPSASAIRIDMRSKVKVTGKKSAAESKEAATPLSDEEELEKKVVAEAIPIAMRPQVNVKRKKSVAASKHEVKFISDADVEKAKEKFADEIQDSKFLQKWVTLLGKMDLPGFKVVKGDTRFVERKFASAQEKDLTYVGKFMRHPKSSLCSFESVKKLVHWKFPVEDSSVLRLDAKLVKLLTFFHTQLTKKTKKSKVLTLLDFPLVPDDVKKDLDDRAENEFTRVKHAGEDQTARVMGFLERLDVVNWESSNSYIGKPYSKEKAREATDFKANNFTNPDCYGAELCVHLGIARTFKRVPVGGKVFLCGAFNKEELVSISAPQSQVMAYFLFRLNEKFFPVATDAESKSFSPEVPLSAIEKAIQDAFAKIPEDEQQNITKILATREKMTPTPVSVMASGGKQVLAYEFESPSAAKAAKDKMFFIGNWQKKHPNFHKINDLFHFETEKNFVLLNLQKDRANFTFRSTKEATDSYGLVESLWKYRKRFLPTMVQLKITATEEEGIQKDAVEIITSTPENRVELMTLLHKLLEQEWSMDPVHGWSFGFTESAPRNTMLNTNLRVRSGVPKSNFHLSNFKKLENMLDVKRSVKIHPTHQFGIYLKVAGSAAKALCLIHKLVDFIDKDLSMLVQKSVKEVEHDRLSKIAAENAKNEILRHNFTAIAAKRDINPHEIIEDKVYGNISLLELAVRQVYHSPTSNINHQANDLAILVNLLVRHSIAEAELGRLIKIAAANTRVVALLEAQKKTPTDPKMAPAEDAKREPDSITKTVDAKVSTEITATFTKKVAELTKNKKPNRKEQHSLQKCLLMVSQASLRFSTDKGWYYEFANETLQQQFCAQIKEINAHPWLKDTFAVQVVTKREVVLRLTTASRTTDSAEDAVNHLLTLQNMARTFNSFINISPLNKNIFSKGYEVLHQDIDKTLSHLSSKDLTTLYQLVLLLSAQKWAETAEGMHTLRYDEGLDALLKTFFAANAPDNINHISLATLFGNRFTFEATTALGDVFVIYRDWNGNEDAITKKAASEKAVCSLQRLLVSIPKAIVTAQKREATSIATQAKAFYEKMAAGKVDAVAADLLRTINFASCLVVTTKNSGAAIADIMPTEISLLGYAVYNACTSPDKVLALTMLEMLLAHPAFKATINQEFNGLTLLDIAILNTTDSEFINKLHALGAKSMKELQASAVEAPVAIDQREDKAEVTAAAAPPPAAAAPPSMVNLISCTSPVVGQPMATPTPAAVAPPSAPTVALPAKNSKLLGKAGSFKAAAATAAEAVAPVATPAAAAPPLVTVLTSPKIALPEKNATLLGKTGNFKAAAAAAAETTGTPVVPPAASGPGVSA